MSRIGKKPIIIPSGTEIKIEEKTVVVKGKEGELKIPIPDKIIVQKEENMIYVKRESDQKKVKSLHGLVRSLINNAVIGVNKPWEKKLKVVGTGYRVRMEGENLVLNVGFSHPVIFQKVPGIKLSVEEGNVIVVRGIDKQLVGQVAYKIKAIKKPDPYKGKGIRYIDEQIKLRPGKKAKGTTG